MFSRGRPCLRRRGLSAVLDTVAAGPEEPLLFLYPRWFRVVLRQQRSVTAASFSTSQKNSSKSARLSFCGSCSRPHRRWSFGGSTRRWVSTHTHTSVVEQTGSAEQADGSLGRNDANRARGIERSAQTENKAGGGGDGRRKDTAVEETVPAAHLEESAQLSNLVDRNVSNKPGKDRRSASISPDVQRTSPTAQADPNGPVQDNALGVMESLSVRDRKKLRYRSYLSRMGKDQGIQDKWGRWTKVGDLLEKMQQDTPMWVKKGAVQKELLIPEETVALMAGITDMAMKENVWYVSVRNGCRVHVLHPHESDGQYRKVILSGSKRSVELLGDRIMRARNLQENGDPLVDIRKPPVPVYPSIETMRRKNLPVPLVRGVWDFYQAFKQPAPLDSLFTSSAAKLSSIREFAEHIEELTRSQSSSRYGRGQPGAAHRERVAAALVALFRDDTYRDLFSTAALNRALSYLFDHEVLDDARAIFVSAEHVATVDTFNILLKSAAKRQDIQVFRGFLHSMSRLQIRPNAYTWLAFLDCLVSSKAKASLVKFMLQKGYLSDTSALRTALQLTIQDSFLIHLQSGQNVDAFFNMIIDTYGANWFPPSLINQMFSVAVRLKDHSSLDRLFEICQQQGLSLDSATINQILPLCRSNIQSALLYMFRCLDHPETQLDKYTWERLFLIAFKGRNYNICRVLWRYACMRGMVTYKMKQSVLTSLVRNVPRNKGDAIDDVWQTTAGNIIVGLDLDQVSYPLSKAILDNLPDEYLDSPVAFLASGYKPAGEDRERQLRVASALVQRDIETGPQYQPSEPFATMLEAAAVMDRGWKGIPRPWPWLVQNSIHVPVRKADFLSTTI